MNKNRYNIKLSPIEEVWPIFIRTTNGKHKNICAMRMLPKSENPTTNVKRKNHNSRNDDDDDDDDEKTETEENSVHNCSSNAVYHLPICVQMCIHSNPI